MRSLVCVTIVLGVLAPTDPHGDPFTFFRPTVVVTATDRAILDRGLPIIRMPDAEGHELAVFTAIEVGSGVTAERMAAWMRNVAEFRKSSYVLAVRRFSSPARIEDLDTLALDDGDLKDIEHCRPGDCGLKLSAAEIEALQRVIRASGKDWKALVQAAFRRMVLQRVTGYAAKGHAALDDYRDRRKPRSPGAAFSVMLQRSTFLQEQAPMVAEALSSDPAATTPDAEEFMYWSKERFGGKAVINATHVRIFRFPGIRGLEVLMTGKQIFATHYLDACLGVTALIRDRRSARGYLLYFNRSDVDLLGGFWGALARRIIEGRVETDGPAILREVSQRLSSGDPPPLVVDSGPASFWR
jgi:hypothetical protein